MLQCSLRALQILYSVSFFLNLNSSIQVPFNRFVGPHRVPSGEAEKKIKKTGGRNKIISLGLSMEAHTTNLSTQETGDCRFEASLNS